MGSSGHPPHPRDTTTTSTEEGWDNATDRHHRLAAPPVGRDWGLVQRDLLWSWDLHVWASAGLFTVLAVLCLASALRQRAQLQRHRHIASLNLFLGILATSRLLVLSLDPYGSRAVLPGVMLQVLWDLGYPCLASAHCLLQLSEGVWGAGEGAAHVTVTVHFCAAITAGVLGAALRTWFRIVWMATHVVFIVWGSFLFFSTLLGCLRMLRSVVKVPLRFLTQVDPGCEVNNIVPLEMFTDTRPEHQHYRTTSTAHHHPRIHITDVDDTTHSYASSVSLHRDPIHRSESLPMRSIPATSPIRSCSPDPRRNCPQDAQLLDDPASVRPLIERQRRYTMAERPAGHQGAVGGPCTIFGSPKQSLPRSLPSIFAEDFPKEPRKQTRPRPSRARLRHLVATSALGLALSLQRAHDVIALDGLLACADTGPPSLRWFLFQTAGRLVELAMAYAMVCGSQQATNRYYHYRH